MNLLHPLGEENRFEVKIEQPFFDEKGTEIKEFNVIRVFHFKGVNQQRRGRKIYYMYKWVRLHTHTNGTAYWVALHLEDDSNDFYHLWGGADKKTRIIKGVLIVQ